MYHSIDRPCSQTFLCKCFAYCNFTSISPLKNAYIYQEIPSLGITVRYLGFAWRNTSLSLIAYHTEYHTRTRACDVKGLIHLNSNNAIDTTREALLYLRLALHTFDGHQPSRRHELFTEDPAYRTITRYSCRRNDASTRCSHSATP